MSTARRDGRRWWQRAYDMALRAFPSDFRARWGEDMRQTFTDRMSSGGASAGVPSIGVILREVGDVIAAGVLERMRAHVQRARLVHLQDIRYAFRLLFKSPGFTLLTVVVLAGGLGLSTFTFSFLHIAMIRPLPLGDGERIVRIDPEWEGRMQLVDAADVERLRASSRTLREVGAFTERDVVIGREGNRRVVHTTVAEPVLFTLARTPALLGRTLIAADAAPGAERVIVLSYRSWEVAFGGERSILDQRVPIDGVSTRVVGIMPEGFGFPVATEAWMALPASTLATTTPGTELLRLAGRLAPNVRHGVAGSEMTALLRRTLAERDTSAVARGVQVLVESFPAAQIGEERVLIFSVLNLLAALILLLALVNVTNLLLARANERVRETAVRLALGASTGRLVMQGMWESVILCVAGGIVGTAGASWGLDAITRWTQANMEGNLAFWWVWHMDRVTVLCAGAFVTVAIAVLGGVVSIRAIRINVREVMQDGSARSGSRHEGRLSRALVATQVTTVTVLMFFGVMSAIMARRVVTMDPGFAVARLLQSGISPPEGRYGTTVARSALYRDVAARVSEDPAFDAVLLRRSLAQRGSPEGRVALRDAPASAALPSAHLWSMLGSLSTIGVSVVEGRSLAASDDASRAPVAMVSHALAARLWPGRSPVGDQLRLAGVGDTTQWRTIVGVASDLPYGNPLARDRSAEAVYVPLLQSGVEYAVVLARYRTSEVAGREALLRTFGAVDPLLIPDGVQPMEEVLRKTGLIATSVSKLFGVCFAFALLLAVVGAYGLMSRSIGMRRREIGVRRALGASDAVVTRLLLTQGGRQLGIGTLIAAPLLAVVGAAFMHFFPIEAWVAVGAGVGVSVAIVVVVLGATWVPTRKVLRVGPREALWGE